MYGREDPAGEKMGFKLVRQFWLYFEINRLERAKEIFDIIQLHYLERATAREDGFFFVYFPKLFGNIW